jgi:hypothetical protein
MVLTRGDKLMSTVTTTDPLTKAGVTRLGDLRIRLLRLHKTLLEMERQDFEKMFGRVTTGELLQLVINHAQFGWLRMISALVVEIDELLDSEEPATLGDFADLVSQARLLFTSPESEEFRTRYQAALQREPSVVMAHAELMQLLREDR